MKVAIINAWALHNELARKELKDYLLTVADFLLHPPQQSNFPRKFSTNGT